MLKKRRILAVTVAGCDVLNFNLSASFSTKQSYLGYSIIVKMHVFQSKHLSPVCFCVFLDANRCCLSPAEGVESGFDRVRFYYDH